jgi:GxxExxY protein
VNSNGKLKYVELTDLILNVFYKRVYARLGYSFLEKVYENAMAFELQESGLSVVRQQKVDVYYRGMVMEGFL